MARKWTNSKGLGAVQENGLERSLDKLRREVMRPEVYNRVYGRKRKPQDNKGRRGIR